MLLKIQWITEEMRKEIKKCLETNGNKTKTIENPLDAVKAVLRGKFTAMKAYLMK